MKTLCIGDCHFGIKSNSQSWLEHQLNFFDLQVIPLLKRDNDITKIIFLGDLFDIRYAINQQIGIEVKKLFRKLCNTFKGDIYLIAGNHDYYSPLEEFMNYNAYQLVFGEEFSRCYSNFHYIDDTPVLVDDMLLLPWYWTENTEHFDELLYNYKFGTEVKSIYCHADLTVWPGGRTASLKGVPVYSGHIHYIVNDKLNNLYNLGAAFSLTFADYNQNRYVYIIEDHKIVQRIENITTPKFIRIYNDDIFKITKSTFDNTYVQICIGEGKINKAKYVEQLKNIKLNFENANIRIKVVDDDETQTSQLNVENFNTDVGKYIDENIPEYLRDKFNLVKSKTLE